MAGSHRLILAGSAGLQTGFFLFQNGHRHPRRPFFSPSSQKNKEGGHSCPPYSSCKHGAGHADAPSSPGAPISRPAWLRMEKSSPPRRNGRQERIRRGDRSVLPPWRLPPRSPRLRVLLQPIPPIIPSRLLGDLRIFAVDPLSIRSQAGLETSAPSGHANPVLAQAINSASSSAISAPPRFAPTNSAHHPFAPPWRPSRIDGRPSFHAKPSRSPDQRSRRITSPPAVPASCGSRRSRWNGGRFPGGCHLPSPRCP